MAIENKWVASQGSEPVLLDSEIEFLDCDIMTSYVILILCSSHEYLVLGLGLAGLETQTQYAAFFGTQALAPREVVFVENHCRSQR